MMHKFAKAMAENITLIAGNVAHVALIDAGIIDGEVQGPTRVEAFQKIEKCKANIAQILMQPGAHRQD